MVTCEINGVPPPLITWSRPAERETNSVNGTTSISKLYYKAKSFRDFGDFECYAKNSLGDIAVTITVKQIGRLILNAITQTLLYDNLIHNNKL